MDENKIDQLLEQLRRIEEKAKSVEEEYRSTNKMKDWLSEAFKRLDENEKVGSLEVYRRIKAGADRLSGIC
jgi:prefoldin subunit 5